MEKLCGNLGIGSGNGFVQIIPHFVTQQQTVLQVKSCDRFLVV